jgi:hypothetical protein
MFSSTISVSPETALQNVVLQVINNSQLVNESGLFYGRMGIAVFLYHYAQCYDNSKCLQLANQLIDDIFERIDDVNTVGYCKGLAGIGAGFEYLAAKGFIDADINELLSDVDNRIHECVKYGQGNTLNLMYGVTGLAKYCTVRAHALCRSSDQDLIEVNRNCISHVIDQLQVSFLWYDSLLSVIDFLSEAYSLQINQVKAEHYLNYAFNKLETTVFEDLHFNLLHSDYDPLRIMAHCSLAASRTKQQAHYDSTHRICQAFQEVGQAYLSVNEASTQNLIKQALICKKLYSGLRFPPVNQLYTDWLNLYLNKQSPMPMQLIENNRLGLVDGCAGEGLALLSLVEKVPMDWIDHLIVYH